MLTRHAPLACHSIITDSGNAGALAALTRRLIILLVMLWWGELAF